MALPGGAIPAGAIPAGAIPASPLPHPISGKFAKMVLQNFMDSLIKADHFVPLPPHGDPLPGHGAGGVIPLPGSWPGNFHDDYNPHPAVVPGGGSGGAMPPAPIFSLPHPGPGFGHSFPLKWPSNLVVAMAPADWLAETMLAHMSQNDHFWDNDDDDDWDWSQEESDESSEDCDESSEENSHEGSHEMGSNENANENSGEGTEGSGPGVESNEDLSNEGK